MKLKDRIKTYNFWVSLSSAIFLIIKLLGQQFHFNVDESLFSDIITSLCGILVLLGIIAPPTNKSVGVYQESQSEYDKIIDEICEDEDDQANNSSLETQRDINDNNVAQEIQSINTNQITEKAQAENDEYKLQESQIEITEEIIQKSDTEIEEPVISEKSNDNNKEQDNFETEETQQNTNDNVKTFLSDVLNNNNLDDVAKLEIINSLKAEFENFNN